jgi:hypothetical protein
VSADAGPTDVRETDPAQAMAVPVGAKVVAGAAVALFALEALALVLAILSQQSDCGTTPTAVEIAADLVALGFLAAPLVGFTSLGCAIAQRRHRRVRRWYPGSLALVVASLGLMLFAAATSLDLSCGFS